MMVRQFEDFIAQPEAGDRTPPLRSDPLPRHRHYSIVSVDDHLMEPPDIFSGRLPSKYAEAAPRVVRDGNEEYWTFGDERVPNLSANGIISWDPSDWFAGAVRYDELRPGIWDVKARLADMDIGGIWASLGFPSMVFGFAGQRLMKLNDTALGLACLKAYNDWVAEEWVAEAPDRLIACQIPWLLDADLAADEIYRNAERGFKAVAFTENPEKLGLPSIYDRSWDPFFKACEETETAVNLHLGSSSETPRPSSQSPLEVVGILFHVNAIMTSVDWLYSEIPVRFPRIKIVLSEGYIGWIPGMIDRLEYLYRSGGTGVVHNFEGTDLTPLEVFRRNFFFTTFWDPTGFRLREQIGTENIMVESDYPHADSTWPDTQEILHQQLETLPQDDVDRVTHLNAGHVYRLQLPPPGWVSSV